MKKGLIHVYTGDGKGKTTAAVGLAARALGAGRRVLIVQFLKGGGKPSGEMDFLKGRAEVMRFTGQRHPMFCKGGCDVEKLRKSINDGFHAAWDKVMSGGYDLVIFDEINNCMKEGWLPPEEALKLIKDKPASVELVLTGRGAPGEIIELADYVTEMRMIKHPAQGGVKARKGVEF